MPRYITRVELHGANDDDYRKLHEAMEYAGFTRQITGSDGRTYHLPTAEYYRNDYSTGEQVRASASFAASKTGRAHSVLVSQADTIWWQGLPSV